jgi:hypothetical protein
MLNNLLVKNLQDKSKDLIRWLIYRNKIWIQLLAPKELYLRIKGKKLFYCVYKKLIKLKDCIK